MSNLTNVYSILRNNYADIDIIYGNQPVSYLQTLLNEEDRREKWIFIYKEDKTRKKSTSSTGSRNTPEKILDISNNSSLIGSPLKDDCKIEVINDSFNKNNIGPTTLWSDAEEQFASIPIALARKISNEISNETFSPYPKGRIWILCNDNNDSIIGMGTYFEDSNAQGIIKYKNIVDLSEITMEKLLAIHYSFIQPTAKLETKVETYFDLNSYMQLKFTNETVSKNPSLAVDESSEVILYQQIGIDKIQDGSLLEDFWTQIILLNQIKEIIIAYKTIEDAPVYKLGLGVEFETLQQQINKSLEDFGVTAEDENEMRVDRGLESIIKRSRNRPLIDLTDQLWDYLKYAASYNVLKQAFTYIFQVAIRSNIVNIPTNNNRIAELIRDLTQQRLAIPNLTGTEPLELLLEIGIEKLMKDYRFIFSESKICSLNAINFNEQPVGEKVPDRKSLAAPNSQDMARKTLLHVNSQNCVENSEEMVGIRNSRFSESEVDWKISKLAQIHLLIEHLVMIQNNLNLDNDYEAIAHKILEKPVISFDVLNEKLYDKLEIPILSKKANNLVENSRPSAKKVIMRSENRFKKIENVFYFNMDLILPPHVLNLEDIDVKPENNEKYHFFHSTKLSTVAF